MLRTAWHPTLPPTPCRWCDRDFDFPVIEAGSSVSFAFTSFERDADGAFSVVGSLSTPHTGLVRKTGEASAKRKRGADDDEGVGDAKQKKKKSKKNKDKSTSLLEHDSGVALMREEHSNGGAAGAAVEAATSDKPIKKNKNKNKEVVSVVEEKAAAVDHVLLSAQAGVTGTALDKKAKKKKKKHDKEKGLGSS
jgi:hypothetical protein